MDSKFYVSLEAARLLKEKGYKRDVTNYYNENGFLHYIAFDGDYDYFQMSNNDLDLDHYAAPTKAEAIDWLESKGIVVEAFYTSHNWFFIIINFNVKQKTFSDEYYFTRLEAEEDAIIKALEML